MEDALIEYIRSDDGALMVRRSSHQFVAAEYAVRRRMIIAGRVLTREAVSAMLADRGVPEAAE
jgi:hypothetical protein